MKDLFGMLNKQAKGRVSRLLFLIFKHYFLNVFLSRGRCNRLSFDQTPANLKFVLPPTIRRYCNHSSLVLDFIRFDECPRSILRNDI